jgi:hypothetical protein
MSDSGGVATGGESETIRCRSSGRGGVSGRSDGARDGRGGVAGRRGGVAGRKGGVAGC